MSGCYFHVIKCKQWNESICCPLCSGRMIMTQNNHTGQKIIKRPFLMEIKATSWKLSVRVWTKIRALTYSLLLDLVILDRIMSCWCSRLYTQLTQAVIALLYDRVTGAFSPFGAVTCGEDDILGDELMIHDGELRQLDLVHPRHSIVSSSPVELDVICSVTIWHREQELLRIVNSLYTCS